EKDTRPVTSRVLVKLSEVYGVDSTFFASDSDTRLIAAVTEALEDPQISTGVPAADVVDMVRAHPDLAQAFATLHQRPRAAEDLTTRIRMNRGDVGTELEIRLAETHGVQIVRRVDLPDGLWHRFSPTERRLELSAHLTTGQQAFRVASELAFLEHGGLLD